jgi:SAM-dependent methyltransferase
MHSAYSPHGAALLDYFHGNEAATLICTQDGVRDDVPAAFWFREVANPLELEALDRCRGRVLDLGAGTGIHSIELQRRGLEVTAIDVAQECVDIMRRRGVRHTEVADLYDFTGGPFDTIICLCNGLDKVGRLADLPRFLTRIRDLLAPGGALLADSFDLRIGADEHHLREIARKQERGRYFGEMDMAFEYNNVRGEPFTVLQVDPATLSAQAGACKWTCDILSQTGGHYLARLIAH